MTIALGSPILPADVLALPQSLADGSAASPAIAAANDVTTGFFRDPTSGAFRYAGKGTALVTLGERVSLSAFHLPSDADWSSAFQRAHDYLAARSGGVVLCPAGQLPIGSVTVNITAQVSFRGQGWSEGGNVGAADGTIATAGAGTWLLVSSSANVPFSISGAGARGTSFEAMAVMQQHPVPGSASIWSPTVYPFVWSVTGVGGELLFRDLFLCGIYAGFEVTGTGRVEFERVKGQVFHRGCVLDVVEDTPTFHHLHFWPYWSNSSAVNTYTQANAVGVELQRVDGPRFSGECFGYAMLTPILCSSSASGVCNLFQIDALTPDACKYGLWITGTSVSGQIGQLFTGGETGTTGVIPGSTGIQIDGSATLQIGLAKLFDCASSGIAISNTAASSFIAIGSLIELMWNQSNTGAVAILAASCTPTPHTILIASRPSLLQGNGAAVLNSPSNAIMRLPGVSYQVVEPVSGDTYGIPNWCQFLAMQPSAAISGITIALPSFALDGDEFVVASTAAISGITWSAGSTPMGNQPSSMTAGQRVIAKFLNTSSPIWFFTT